MNKMVTRAQKIISLAQEKTNVNFNASDQQQEPSSLKSTSSSDPVYSGAVCTSSVQKVPELLDLKNLEFLDHNSLNFVVEDNGLLSYVSPDCNADNDSHTPIFNPDLPYFAPDLETESKNDTDGENIMNLLFQKTQDTEIQFDAATLDPDYIPETEDNNIVNDDINNNDPDEISFLNRTSDLDYNQDNSDSDSSISDNPDKEIQEGEVDLQNNDASDAVQYGNMNEGRKRRHRASKCDWKKIKNKQLRMEGKEYLGYTKPKGEMMKQNKIREARSLKPACVSDSCRNSKKRSCEKFTEQERKCIFDKFWSELNWDQRKIFVISHVTRVATKRKTASNESRRGETLNYSLTFKGYKYPVCKKMFLNTLGIGSFTVQSWTKKGDHAMIQNKNCDNLNRVKNLPFAEDIKYLKNFLEQLPKLPSHYNRANSSKQYLEPVFKSLKQLYDLYFESCRNAGKRNLSSKTFYNQFNDSNLALHQPKKDQCDICVTHKVGNLNDAKYIDHIKRKDRARTEKANDKISAQRGECIVLTMDLQAVKVCPVVQASSIFFKTKLSCHNFTIYDVVSHHSTCFWFTECDCDLVASSFTSCIIEYLEKHCTARNLPIIIYSDGCTYQNRNTVLSNALLTYALKHKIPVFQKYLERGHTQMECDSVHSCIERKLKNRNIHLPSDYISATKEARTKPFPYEVQKLGFEFFKDYAQSTFLRYASIRPGKKPNEPTVTDLRALRYNIQGSIDYKLNFDDDWKQLPSRQKKIPEKIPNYPPLNRSKIPIKKSKFIHLQELKNVLPDDCHSFYDLLPYRDC